MERGEWGGMSGEGMSGKGMSGEGVSTSLSLSLSLSHSLQCAGGRWKAPRVVAGRGWS